MSISFTVRREEPLEEGAYRALLSEMRKTDTPFGERILWLFEVPEHNAEVAGFTSLSASTQANAYLWATALNEEIRSKRSWGPEDVVGRGASWTSPSVRMPRVATRTRLFGSGRYRRRKRANKQYPCGPGYLPGPWL